MSNKDTYQKPKDHNTQQYDKYRSIECTIGDEQNLCQLNELELEQIIKNQRVI
jgi:hypothetical protein